MKAQITVRWGLLFGANYVPFDNGFSVGLYFGPFSLFIWRL